MGPIIAYCGLDCAKCEAYQVTRADDEAAKQALLVKWQVEYNSPEMTLESLTCDGCTLDGRLGGYCHNCPVRACGEGRGVANCAYCEDYETCSTLQGFIKDIPEARANLEAIRAAL